MIDPLDSLTFSMHASRGAYAFLVASGVSRAAKIPTGWEIVLDLVRKLAAARGQDPGPDPAAWYRAQSGEDPGYSRLLQALCRSPLDRQQLIRPYIEADEAERRRGLKVPTEAHRAVARLAVAGHVRVILTTNFDPLLEQALRAVGIEPVVVSSPDQIQGLPPLQQIRCLVVKLHGDYQDPRFKNTTEELSRYAPPLRKLLARLLDEFGLVVCGWSAEWDHALRSALEHSASRRFTLFWSHRGPLGLRAAELVALKQAQTIEIADADSFFEALGERLAALDEFARPHPLSVRLLVETVKSYLVDPLHRVRLHDLVSQEIEAAYAEAFSEKRFPLAGVPYDGPHLLTRLADYGAALERLQALLIAGAAWGEPQHLSLWQKSLGRFARPPQPVIHPDLYWREGRRYCLLRLLYAAGVAATATAQFATLRGLLEVPVWKDTGEAAPLVLVAQTGSFVDADTLRAGLGKRFYVPLSEYLFTSLREPLRELIPSEDDYDHLFDLFEYLLALTFIEREGRGWCPPGRFVFKGSDTPPIRRRALAEIDRLGSSWPVLQAGFFGGSVDLFRQIDAAMAKATMRLRASGL